MKKLILASASLAAMTIASPAMAQSASGTPAGTTPAACPAGADNCSILTQSGAANTGSISQTGTGNSSDVSQTGTLGNTVSVLQPSQDNFAVVEQDVSLGAVSANINQEGINSLAEITQIGNAAGDLAGIFQNQLTDFSFAAIEQSGATGGAASGSTANIDQSDGFLNDAAIVQGRTTVWGGTPFSPAGVVIDVDGASASVAQRGDLNTGSIIQGGTNPSAGVFQDSSVTTPVFGNFSLVIQGSGDVSISNFAGVTQNGDDNSSEIYQNDSTAGGNNIATVFQLGNDGNMSRITQNGTANNAGVNQYDGSTSIVNQAGTGNNITVVQGTP